MAGSNSFLEFDANQTNIMTDTNYNNNSTRADGVIEGIADPLLHNKLFRQTSVMCAAIGAWLASLGYTVNDTSVNNLENMLATIITTAGGTINGNLSVTGSTTLNGAVNFNSTATLNTDPTLALQAATKQYVDNKIVVAAPYGAIQAYAGSNAPTGWLLCDGSTISRTTYANLFSVIGSTYGGGDGSTTFTLPYLKDKFILGKGSTYTTLGSTGGEINHTLSISEIPAHNHLNGISDNNTDGRCEPYGVTTTGIPGVAYEGVTSGSGDPAIVQGYTSYTGGSGAHNNMPPYIVLNYIIKY